VNEVNRPACTEALRGAEEAGRRGKAEGPVSGVGVKPRARPVDVE